MQKFKIAIIGPEKVGKSLIGDLLSGNNRDQPKIYRPTIGVRILEFEKSTLNNGKEQ